MIKVKATQAKQTETGLSRSSFETGVEKFSSLPAAFGVFLVGLAVYLKGIVSTRPQAAPPEEGPKVVPAEAEQAASGGDSDATYMRAIIERAEDEYLVDDKEGGKQGDVIHLTSHSGFRARLAETFLPDQAPPIEVPPLTAIDNRPASKVALEGDTIAFNDNARLAAAAGAGGGGGGGGGVVVSSSGGGGGSGSGEGSNPGGGTNNGGGSNHGGGEDPIRRNRAPTVTGPVLLRDVKATCNSTFIPLAALLAGAVDPDGDLLRILNISATAGELKQVDGGFEYDPPAGLLGPVTLTFQIGDGQYAVQQTATFQLVEADPIVGTTGDDSLVGTECRDMIDGDDGNDTIAGLGAGDIILGGDGNDVIDAGAGNDTVFGGAGNDRILAGSGDDIVWGGDGDDTILGQAGADVLMGEAGNDSVSGGDGDDQVFGGDGNDTVAGDAGRDVVEGGAGDDVVSGGDGNDLLAGGTGTDSVSGDKGDDIIVADLDASADRYDGGEGRDTADFAAATSPLELDLVSMKVTGEEIGEDALVNIEVVVAGSGDDVVRFGSQSMAVAGGEGDDCFDFSALAQSLLTAPLTTQSDEGEQNSSSNGSSEGQDIAAAPSVEEVLTALSSAPASAPSQPLTVQEILDFAVGDRIKVGDYSIRMRADDDEGYVRVKGEDGSELRLEVKQLDDRLDDGSSPFKVRIEERDGNSRTVVEVYIDSLDDPDFAIALQGVHALNYYQQT